MADEVSIYSLGAAGISILDEENRKLRACLAELEAVAEEMDETLRDVRSDRPTVHTERIWIKLLSAIASYEAYKSKHTAADEQK